MGPQCFTHETFRHGLVDRLGFRDGDRRDPGVLAGKGGPGTKGRKGVVNRRRGAVGGWEGDAESGKSFGGSAGQRKVVPVGHKQ